MRLEKLSFDREAIFERGRAQFAGEFVMILKKSSA